jgi:hypothetical protein
VSDPDLDGLAWVWNSFAESDAGAYSPLYAAIGRGVANDRDVLTLVSAAPPASHLPIMLLAAVHDLVLAGLDHPLADVYAGRSNAEPVALFRDVCLTNRDAILATLARRHVQTNECGRSPLIALALDAVTQRYGPLDALIDSGASAGLNLLFDRYRLDYGDLGVLGDAESPVVARCDVRSRSSIPTALPPVPVRLGLDREPVDITNGEDARWLLACVWPDTDRLPRAREAIALAEKDPPTVLRGEMIADLPAVIAAIDGDGLVCVLTSWAAGYLLPADRKRFVEMLEAAAVARPVIWVCLDVAGVMAHGAVPAARSHFDIDPSVLGVAGFGAVADPARALALVHPHGSAIEWL